MNYDIKALEFDKILKLLAECCATDDGKQKAVNIMPVNDLFLARSLQEKTKKAFEMSMKYGLAPIHGVYNVTGSCKAAGNGASLSLLELIRVQRVLSQMGELRSYRDSAEISVGELDRYFSMLYVNRQLRDRLANSIVSEEELSDNASDELYSIRRKIMKMQDGIRVKLEKVISSPSFQKYLQEPIVVMRNSRYVVPVKSEFRSQVAGLVHDTSGSGATMFVEPMAVVELNNDIRLLKSKEKEECERIISELSAQVGEVAESIITGYGVLIELDLLFAKANLGIKWNGNFPILNSDGITMLKKARHPLIDKADVVPIDIGIGKGYSSLIITGPNTGGKTVALKTIGLFTLLSQSGMMIPTAEDSDIAVYSKIYADIGDEQSIEQSLSTFSSHIKRIVTIIENADDETLVLLDELGAGTDPVEGDALAVSILETLKSCGCKLAATTHYEKVKAYAIGTPDVENAGCEFDIVSLRPTYKIIMGVPGRSNAFAICKRLGLSEYVIEKARLKINDEEMQFENVIAELNKHRLALQRKLSETEVMKKAVEAELAKSKENTEELLKRAEDEVEKARLQAKKIIDKVSVNARSVEDQIEIAKKKAKDDPILAAQRMRQIMRGSINKLEDMANPEMEAFDDGYVLPRDPVVGDIVFIKTFGKNGEVKEVDLQNRKVMIAAGAIKTRVSFDDIKLSEQKIKKPKHKNTRTISKANRKVENQVDLRGMTADEAIMEVDMFIDNCVITGVVSSTIIHGIGTGVLKREIRRHLKTHPSIKSQRPGLYGEGEDGVTIVEYK